MAVHSLPSSHLISDDNQTLNFFKFNELPKLQNQELIPDGHYTGYLWPFRMCRSPADSDYETSHLLSNNYYGTSSLPSPTLSSGIQDAAEEGRKVLMEIIQSTPEPSYELSLRDIIDHHKHILNEEAENKITLEENFAGKIQKNLSRRKNHKSSVQSSSSSINGISRREFQLKMFIPLSLVFNKKQRKGIWQTVPSRPLFNGHFKSKPNEDKGCRSSHFEFPENMDKIKCKSSVTEGADTNSTSKNGLLQRKFPYRCWFF